MIKLFKLPIPSILLRKAAHWAREVQGAIDAGEKDVGARNRKYSHADIKNQLIAETKSKCAYCESKITHIDFGDVEHITPKKMGSEYWFEWSNLTLACSKCNNSKRDRDPASLVDPYADDPDEHFLMGDAVILPFPGSHKGRTSLAGYDLNRLPLVERRQEKKKNLVTLIEAASNAPNEQTRTEILKEFDLECGSDAEYASIGRALRHHPQLSEFFT